MSVTDRACCGWHFGLAPCFCSLHPKDAQHPYGYTPRPPGEPRPPDDPPPEGFY